MSVDIKIMDLTAVHRPYSCGRKEKFNTFTAEAVPEHF